MSRLRLLVALDALLVEQSVGRAAERMGIGAPAMSRLLKQIRDLYGDPILRKTGRGMVATPFAETLRLRLRAVAEEAGDLLASDTGSSNGRAERERSNRKPLSDAPALAIAQVVSFDGPTPRDFAAKLEAIGPFSPPHRRLAKVLATIGMGVGRSRPLTVLEAEDALDIILAGKADPVQIGALLSVLTYRGATATELAGFAMALRRHFRPARSQTVVDLDWPAYLSPKTPLQPWFLMAAKLVSTAGYSVLIHGEAGRTEEGDRLSKAATLLGVETATSLKQAGSIVREQRIAFLPLSRISGQAQALKGLYRLFEMRSSIHQVVHLINPLDAETTMIGAFSFAHEELPREAAAVLGMKNLLLTTMHRDVAEATPDRLVKILRLVDGAEAEHFVVGTPCAPVSRPSELTSLEYWQAIWSGKARDEEPVRRVIETTALALLALRRADPNDLPALRAEAERYWRDRPER